jgi:hypothetical protein
LQDWGCDVLHGGPKGTTYEETIGPLDDWFGGQHLAAGYCDQLKTDPNPGWALTRACHHHRTVVPLCLSCTTQVPEQHRRQA